MKKKLSKLQAEELDIKVEELELHDLSGKEIDRVVKGISTEGLDLRRTRKKVRYQLYRLKNEAFGTTSNVSDKEFIERFESHERFAGWKKFGETWDVALDDPYEIVHIRHSHAEEWEELVKAKYPQLTQNGGVIYPDIKVKKKIEAEAKIQNAKKKKKGNK